MDNQQSLPLWLRELANALTACIEPVDARAPIGCHACCVEGTWEITLFVSRTEILGGEHDGEVIPGRFVLDVGAITEVVQQIDRCWWQPLSAATDDDLGSHLSILGHHAEEPVWIRITAEQPAGIESGRVANMATGLIERRW